MPNSLKCQINKLRYKGRISEEEHKIIMTKLDGHDKKIKEEILQEVQAGIENILRQYEEDKENIPKPSALSIYAYVVALGELL